MTQLEDKIKSNTYLVGGAVRDKIIGKPNADLDYVVVGITPEEMIQAGFEPILANEFPIFIKDNSEYALARKEVKTGDGYKGFEVFTDINVTLEADLMRRDLTINSIAMDSNGNYIDPYNGIQDIHNKILRHTSEAFKEDPVRVLRVCRFMSQLNDFTIASDTLRLMKEMVDNGELNHLTPERIWKETEKALKSDSPWLFFKSLKECGALRVIFPELHNLIGVTQPLEHHPEDCCFVHTMLTLKQSTVIAYNDPIVNFAILMHDLGKGVTDKSLLPSHIGHETAGVPLVKALCDRLKVPNSYRNLALKVTEFHLHAHRALDMKPSKIIKLLDNLGAWNQSGREKVIHFLIACEADARGRLGFENRKYPQCNYILAIYWKVIEMDNSEIIERYEGKKIGEMIHQARIKVAGQVKREWTNNE